MAKNYINNREFSNSVDEWIERKSVDSTAVMSQYLGECILTLVNRYGSKSNFSGYTYLDDMKTEALYLCVIYAHNYRSDKAYGNAFGYFSKIVENAFKCVINRERNISDGKFNYIKYLCDIEGYDYKNYENTLDADNVYSRVVICPICNKKLVITQTTIQKHLATHPQISEDMTYPLSVLLENKRGCLQILTTLTEEQQQYVKSFVDDSRKLALRSEPDATI